MVDNGIKSEFLRLLDKHGFTLSTAESLTGGMLSSNIVDIPGISAYFKEGFITYCNKAKHDTLGVSRSILDRYGAISEKCALAMALGAAGTAGTDVSIAVTGNAGPSADEGKPVGLVYIAVSCNGSQFCYEYIFSGTRNEIREKTVLAAFERCIEVLKEC